MATSHSQQHLQYFEQAAKVAEQSLCLRRRCGSVVVKNGRTIGQGYNAPPQDDISIRRCNAPIDKYKKYPTDKTCCMHAEQRAILDACKQHPEELIGASLYFVSIDDQGSIQDASSAYCTICSKMALEVGIKYFCLYNDKKTQKFDAKEYNNMSYASQKHG